MLSRSFLAIGMTIVCVAPISAMKRANRGEFNRGGQKKQKIESLHDMYERDDLYLFWVEATFGDLDVNEKDKEGLSLRQKIANNAACITKQRQEEYFDIMLRNGADVHVKDKEGCTLLQSVSFRKNYIAEDRRHEYFDILLNNGADPNVQTQHMKRTPLHTAVIQGDVLAIKKLIGAGANANIQEVNGLIPFDYIHFKKSDIALAFVDHTDPNHISGCGNSLLHNMGLDKPTVEFLILHGVPFNVPNNNGENAYQFLKNRGAKPFKCLKSTENARQVIMPTLTLAIAPKKSDDYIPGMQSSITKSILNRQITGKRMSNRDLTQQYKKQMLSHG